MRDGDPLGVRFSEAVDRFALWLERNRLSVIGVFVYIVSISVIRDLAEYFLLDHEFVTTSHPWIFSIAHHVAFYLVTFLGLVLLLTAFSGRGLRRSVNYLCTFFWIIILPPFIDHYFFGMNSNYSYSSATDFLNALIHFSGANFHPGQALEVGVVLFGLGAYAFWLQRTKLDSPLGRLIVLLKVSLLMGFSFMAMFILATPGAYLPVGSEGGFPVFPNFETTRYYQFHLFMLTYYLLVGMALIAVLVKLSTNRLSVYVRSMRPFQTTFFIAIMTAGTALGWSASGGSALVTSILQKPYWVNLSFLGMALVSSMLVWMVSAMWNDISDRGMDDPHTRPRVLSSGLMGPRGYAQISLLLLIIALSIALIDLRPKSHYRCCHRRPILRLLVQTA